jgi:L-amino acid N-acyltransferase YncA/protein-tyrosine-phosphatase
MSARPAVHDDAEAMACIYNEGIDDRVATFETRHRTPNEVRVWLEERAYPAVVVEEDGVVLAFARSGPMSARACYARNAEFSVYVARRAQGRGAGSLAMRALVDAARAAGLWKLVSGVFTGNVASLQLLDKLGFRTVGVHEAHGVLDGRWRDVAIVERIVAPTVLFACVHNAGRSQIAAAMLARRLDLTRVRVLSAGTEPAARVHREVVTAMREIGIDILRCTPRRLDPALAAQATVLVTMGCGEACPAAPFASREDWPLEDPKGRGLERVRELRDDIAARVEDLARRMGWE